VIGRAEAVQIGPAGVIFKRLGDDRRNQLRNRRSL